MDKAIPYKTNQLIFVLIKLSLVLAAFYFIYHKLTQNANLDFSFFISRITHNQNFSFQFIILLLALSSLNWMLEIKKWQLLVEHLLPISFKSASQQTLSALTASLITPNRVGDYGAKALYYKPRNRKKIVLLNGLANLMQMAVTLVFGSIGLSILAKTYTLPFHNQHSLALAFSLAIGIVLIILLFKHPFFKSVKTKLRNALTFLIYINIKTQVNTLLLSLLRYSIFSFQFYVILLIFDVNISYDSAMIILSTMYLLTSIIPSIFIFDIVVKSGIAVYLFGLLSIPAVPVLCATTLMWILNFVLPSGIGGYFILRFNPLKTE